MIRAHARLAPSAASRWMACPGSARLCQFVVDSGSDDADRGTACHAVLERALREGGDALSYAGRAIVVGEKRIEVTKEMAGWVAEVVAWVVWYLDAHPGASLRTEERIAVGRAFGVPDDVWGTADVVVVGPEEILVHDAKFGYVEVGIDDNPQLLLYTIGLAADYGWVFERYRTVIHQPQCGAPKERAVSRGELLDYQRRYLPKIRATFDPEAPLVPSDEACRWCPAAGVCPALQERAIVLAQREFASLETISVDDLSALLTHATRIRAGLDAAERHALKLIQLGGRVPGFKIVGSKKHRVWRDEAAAEATLRKLGYDEDDFRPRRTITPPQAEKLVGKRTAAQLAPLIEWPTGEPTLVPEADSRPPLAGDFQPILPPADVAAGELPGNPLAALLP